MLACAVYGVGLDLMRPTVGGDEPHYAIEAASLARDGDRDLNNQYLDPRLVESIAPGETLLAHASMHRGRLISSHSVGLPLLLAPVARVTTKTIWMRVELVLLAALAAALLLRIVRRFDTGWRGWLAWGMAAFSLPLVAYAPQLYPELPAALCTLLAVDALLAGPRRRLSWLLGAAGLAFLPWLHPRFLLIVVGATAAMGLRCWFDRRSTPVVNPVALWLAVVAGSLGLLAFQYDRWYGSPLPSAIFSQGDTEPAANPAPAAAAEPPAAQRGSTGGEQHRGYVATQLDRVSAKALYGGFVERVLSPSTGWLPFAPAYLVALIGFLALLVVDRRRGALLAAVALPYLFVVMLDPSTIGFAFPGRFLVAVSLLAAIPLVVALRVRGVGPVAVALAAFGASIVVAGATHTTDLYASGSQTATRVPIVHATAPAWPLARFHPRRSVSYPLSVGEGSGLSRSSAVEVAAGLYGAAFDVQATGASGAVAQLAVYAGGDQLVTQQGIDGDAVIGRRTFLLPFRVTGRTSVRLELRHGPGFRLRSAQVAGSQPAGSAARHYLHWPLTLGWVAGLLAAALVVAGASRPRPS